MLSVYPHRGFVFGNSSLLFTIWGTNFHCMLVYSLSPGPRQHSYDLQRNTTSSYGKRGWYYCEWQNYLQHKKKAFVNITIFHTVPSASKPIHSHSQALVSLLELPCETPVTKLSTRLFFLGHQCRLTVTGDSSRGHGNNNWGYTWYSSEGSFIT